MERTSQNSIKIDNENYSKTDKTIQILMSTYNGEQYLREQLDSFTRLEGFDKIKVLIRDDGSIDNTCKILEEYKTKYGFEIIKGRNIGITNSIFELFASSDKNCEFFAISDQDDVWIEDKFTRAVSAFQKENSKMPMMYASISEIVSESLEHMGTTLIPTKDVGFYNAMVQNVTPGHTQVYNRKLIDLLLERGFDNVTVVDWWIYLVVSAVGKVVFENVCTVKHRQHGKNSVGYQTNFISKTITRIRKLKCKDANAISRQLQAFYIRYNDVIKEEYKLELKKYLNNLKSIFMRIRYISVCKAYRQTLFETFMFKILYILGKYNI